jgi:hypothetical protein
MLLPEDGDSCRTYNQPAGTQLSLSWDTGPPNKWKIQFYYTRMPDPAAIGSNKYSLASNDTSEGGGFRYEACSQIFSGRRGYGALRVAWDTNILIDYAKYGQLMWETDEFDPPIQEDRYREELIALKEFMNLWMLRDIRIRMPFRQIGDAGRRLDDKTCGLRRWQLEQFHVALSCVSLDAEIDASVKPFEALPEESSHDDWDKSLVEEAIATGCHVFLTGDRRLKKRLVRAAGDSFVAILSPTEVLDFLAEAGELSLARIGQEVLPDTHKFTHIIGAHENGYPGL